MQELKTRSPSTLRTLVFLLALSVSTACSAPRTFREAQDAFNQAAALENATQLEDDQLLAVDPEAAELGPDFVVANAYQGLYERAHKTLVELIDEEQAQLETDGLYVPSLTLKALCEWRLEDWSAAEATATKARGLASPATGRRDYVVLVAMPGLIRNDQAYALLEAWRMPGGEGSLDDLQKLLWDPQVGALKSLQDARVQSKGHPVDRYVVLSQLAVAKNLSDAHLLARKRVPGEIAAQMQVILEALQELLPPPAGQDAHPLVQRWALALGL